MFVFAFFEHTVNITTLINGSSFHCSTETECKELQKQLKVFKNKSTRQNVLIFEGNEGSGKTHLMQHLCNKLMAKKKKKKHFKNHRYVCTKVKIGLWLNLQKDLVDNGETSLFGSWSLIAS